MNFIECPSCEAEFRVISDSVAPVTYCPFCAEVIPDDGDEDEYSVGDDLEDDY